MFDLDPLSLTMAIMAAVIFGATVTFPTLGLLPEKAQQT